MEVDQDKHLTEEAKPTTAASPNKNVPSWGTQTPIESMSEQNLLDWVSKEGDEFVPQEQTFGMNRFLLAMLCSSIAVAIVVAIFVLVANGHWITRYMP